MFVSREGRNPSLLLMRSRTAASPRKMQQLAAKSYGFATESFAGMFPDVLDVGTNS